MQYVVPTQIHTEGLIKIRYRTIFLLMAFICTYYYGRTSYSNLTEIKDAFSPRTKTRLARQSTPPRNYIGFIAITVPQIAAGRLAEMFSAKWIMFSAVLMLTLCLVMMPMAINVLERNIYLDVINVVMMLSHGCIFPASHAMFARWSPPRERFVMGSLLFAGYYLGKSLAIFISSWVSVTIGWEYTFYVSAGLNVLLMFVWTEWVKDDPSEDEKIGEEEKKYLMDSLRDDLYQYRRRLESRVPWKDIFRSGHVWAAMIGRFEYMLSKSIFDYQLETESRMFRKNNVMDPLNKAVILTMPYVWLSLLSCFLGLIFYNLVMRDMKKVRVYRIGYFIFLLGAAINLVYFCFYDEIKANKWEVVSALHFSVTGYLCVNGVYFVDIAPNYAGTLMGYEYTVSEIAGFFLTLLKKYNAGLWQSVVIYCNGFFILLAGLVSLVYFSADHQLWNNHCHLLEVDDVYTNSYF